MPLQSGVTASGKFSGAGGLVLTKPVMGRRTGETQAVEEDGDDRSRGRRIGLGIDGSVRVERQRKTLIKTIDGWERNATGLLADTWSVLESETLFPLTSEYVSGQVRLRTACNFVWRLEVDLLLGDVE